MKTYEQVLETVELALAKGEYQYCIEFILPIIESFPLSSKEGIHSVSYTHLTLPTICSV